MQLLTQIILHHALLTVRVKLLLILSKITQQQIQNETSTLTLFEIHLCGVLFGWLVGWLFF